MIFKLQRNKIHCSEIPRSALHFLHVHMLSSMHHQGGGGGIITMPLSDLFESFHQTLHTTRPLKAFVCSASFTAISLITSCNHRPVSLHPDTLKRAAETHLTPNSHRFPPDITEDRIAIIECFQCYSSIRTDIKHQPDTEAGTCH